MRETCECFVVSLELTRTEDESKVLAQSLRHRQGLHITTQEADDPQVTIYCHRVDQSILFPLITGNNNTEI